MKAEVGVRDDDVCRDALARREPHPDSRAISHLDLRHLGIAAHLAALPFDQTDQRLNQAACSAHHEAHAPLLLQEGDQAVDRAGAEGISADQERMEAKDDAKAGVADVSRHQAVDGAEARQPDHVRHDPRHVGEGIEGDVAEPLEADAKDRFAHRHEAVVPGDIGRGKPGDLGAHGVAVGAGVKDRAVVEHDAIERRNPAQLDVVGHPPAAQGPELFEEKRRRDDGRPGIEREAVLAEDIGAAPRRIEPLQHGHPVAARAQPDGGGQPTKSAADDDRMRACAPHREGRSVARCPASSAT